MRWITSRRVTLALPRSCPPQCGQTARSIAPGRIANGMLVAMQSAKRPPRFFSAYTADRFAISSAVRAKAIAAD